MESRLALGWQQLGGRLVVDWLAGCGLPALDSSRRACGVGSEPSRGAGSLGPAYQDVQNIDNTVHKFVQPFVFVAQWLVAATWYSLYAYGGRV